MAPIKKWYLFLLIMIILPLSACGEGITTSAGTPTATPWVSYCNPVSVEPTPGPEESLFPPVNVNDHIQGPENAAVTFLVYSDFQCQTCAALQSMLKLLRSQYPNDLRMVFRLLPLVNKFDKSALASRAAEAAAMQGKFWEIYDILYEKQADWILLSAQDFETWVANQAEALGMDRAKFVSDMNGNAVQTIVQQAIDLSAQIPLPPLLIINNRLQSGSVNFAALDTTIRLIMLGKRAFTNCPPVTIDPQKQYIASLQTAKGEIVIQLYADKTPITVSNFVFLAKNGWYENITFHRVLPGFLVQAGDPSGTGLGNPGYFIPNEPVAALKFDKPGVVGMVNSGPDLNGSQFFITLAPAPQLNGQYTIFGQVISGMEILAQLTPRDAQPGTWLPAGDSLINIIIEEK
jgi:cyclophilin family peptidyl-prolyl cis-trans isomerase/protein-disulfide isomerase